MSAQGRSFRGGLRFAAAPRPEAPPAGQTLPKGRPLTGFSANPGPAAAQALLADAGLRALWAGPAEGDCKAILVDGLATAPFLPSFASLAAADAKPYTQGLELLRKAFGGVEATVYVLEDELAQWQPAFPQAKGLARRYPQEAEEVLVQAHLGRQRSAASEGLLIVPAEDLPLVEQVLARGEAPAGRAVLVASPEKSWLLRAQVGQTFADLLGAAAGPGVEIIVGNVLNGRARKGSDAVDLSCREISLLPLRLERPLLGFLRFGNRIESDTQGQLRFCVSCSQCEWVCPAGLLPQFLHKLVQADLPDEAEELGLTRCVECGLCSHVCPSKIELLDIFVQGKKAIGANL